MNKTVVHLHHHTGDNTDIAELVELIQQMKEIIMADLSELQNAVAENTSVTQSAVALIQGLADQIEDNATDEAALAGIVSDLRAQGDALAAAVAENTPGAEEPTPEEPVEPFPPVEEPTEPQG